MKIYLGYNKIKILLVYSIISILLITFILFVNTNSEDFLRSCGIVSLIHVIISLVCLKHSGRNYLSIAGVFLIIAFILHYSQFILLLFPEYEFQKGNFITRYPVDIYSIAFYKCITITTMLTIGLICGGRNNYSEANKLAMIEPFDNSERRRCIKIGLLLTLVLFPLRAYIDVQRLMIGFTLGYSASLHDVNVNNAFIVLSRLSTASVILLIYGLEKKSLKRKIVFGIYALYLVLMMLSGSRISFMISLVVLCMCYVRFEEIRISWKNILVIIVAVIILTAVMAATREFRYYNLGNNASITGYIEVFTRKLTKENSLLHEFEELGQSFYTCSAAVDHVQRYGYAYGRSYYLGITAVLPNFTGLVNTLDVMSSYTRTMQAYGITANYVNIGGSFIGELIFNYRFLFPFFSLVIGLFISRYSDIFDEKISKVEGDYTFIYSVCIMIGILEWSRDTFSASVRSVCWGCILFWLANKVFYKRKT